jgi:hypothetical protein
MEELVPIYFPFYRQSHLLRMAVREGVKRPIDDDSSERMWRIHTREVQQRTYAG